MADNTNAPGPDGRADADTGKTTTVVAAVTAKAGDRIAVETEDQQTAERSLETPETIGQLETIEGTVTILRVDGARVIAAVGSPLYRGDKLETAEDGRLGAVFLDQTQLSLGPDGLLTLDEMVYDPDAQEGSALMSLSRGVFSFISGEISRTSVDAMVLQTPVATIGIRGTAGSVAVDDSEEEPEFDVVLLTEEDGQVGEIVVSTLAGEVFTVNQPLNGISVTGNGLAQSFILTPDQFNQDFGQDTGVILDADTGRIAQGLDFIGFRRVFENRRERLDREDRQDRDDQQNAGDEQAGLGPGFRFDENRLDGSGGPDGGPDNPNGDLGGFGGGAINGGDGDGSLLGGINDDLLAGDGNQGAGFDPSIFDPTDPNASSLFSFSGTYNLTQSVDAGNSDDRTLSLLSFDNANQGVSVMVTSGYSGLILNDGQGGSGSFSGINAFVGTDFDDRVDAWRTLDQVTVLGSAGDDQFLGSRGRGDRMDYSLATSAIQVDMRQRVEVIDDGFGGSDDLSSVHDIVGTAYDDTFQGSGASEVFWGGDGDDVFSSGGGADTFIGGAGDDVFFDVDGSSPDIFDGGDGYDIVDYSNVRSRMGIDSSGVEGGLVLHWGSGSDILTSIEEIILGSGDDDFDLFHNGHGNPLSGGLGSDSVDVLTSGIDLRTYTLTDFEELNWHARESVTASINWLSQWIVNYDGLSNTHDDRLLVVEDGVLDLTQARVESVMFDLTDPATQQVVVGAGTSFERDSALLGGIEDTLVIEAAEGLDLSSVTVSGFGSVELRLPDGSTTPLTVTLSQSQVLALGQNAVPEEANVNLVVASGGFGGLLDTSTMPVDGGWASIALQDTNYSDQIIASNGDDTILVDDGNDRLFGGAGSDRYVMTFGADHYKWIEDASGANDTIVLEERELNYYRAWRDSVGDLTLSFSDLHYDHRDALRLEIIGHYNASDSIEYLDWTGGSGLLAVSQDLSAVGDQASLIVGTRWSETIWGGEAGDVISTDMGDDTVFAGGGDDLIEARGGDNVLDGGAGFDGVTYRQERSGLEVIAGSETGDWTMTDTDGSDVDQLRNVEWVETGIAADVIDASAASAWADTTIVLSGLDGDDILMASDHGDDLIGGRGDDQLFGGAGADRFIFDASVSGDPGSLSAVSDLGTDAITNFTAGSDIFVLFQDVFNLGHDGTLTEGINYAELDSELGWRRQDTGFDGAGIIALEGETGVDIWYTEDGSQASAGNSYQIATVEDRTLDAVDAASFQLSQG